MQIVHQIPPCLSAQNCINVEIIFLFRKWSNLKSNSFAPTVPFITYLIVLSKDDAKLLISIGETVEESKTLASTTIIPMT